MDTYTFEFTVLTPKLRVVRRQASAADLLEKFDAASAWMIGHPERTASVFGPRVQRALVCGETRAYIVREVIGEQPTMEPTPAAIGVHPGPGQETGAVTEVMLIIRHRTSGGREIPHTLDDGELVEVSIDGQRRPAKTGDVGAAYRWLQERGFEPAGFTWLDRAGLIRRRRQVYRVKANA